MEKLKDKVAVITGGSSGIGAAIARRFASEGSKVVIASRNLDKCQAVESEIRESGGCAISIRCNVEEPRSVSALFEESKERLGCVDIAVASAGVGGGSDLLVDFDVNRWEKLLKTNITGVFLTVQQAFRQMMGAGGGTILIMSSLAGVEGFARKGPYCASKFAVRGLAQALAEEGREFDITVSAICPGTVMTPILGSNLSVKHPMQADDIAETALFLASFEPQSNIQINEVVLRRRHVT